MEEKEGRESRKGTCSIISGGDRRREGLKRQNLVPSVDTHSHFWHPVAMGERLLTANEIQRLYDHAIKVS